MEKHNNTKTNDMTLDNDVLETLVEAQEPVSISPELKARMKKSVMQKIKQEKSCESEGFITQRHSDGEWVTPMSGAHYKILRDDGNGLDGVISYLIKLEAGVELEGHNHPFDEECLMLEGDLSFGDLTLNKGDFHFVAAGLRHSKVSTKQGCIAFIRGALPV